MGPPPPQPGGSMGGGSLQLQGSFLTLWALPLTSGFPNPAVCDSSGFLLSLPNFGAPSQFPGLSTVLCLGLTIGSCPCGSELTSDIPPCCHPPSL